MRNKPRDDLSAEYVRARLDYNPETGEFFWKHSDLVRKKSWNTKFAGKPAGFVKFGYVAISLLDKPYMAHRLAWIFMTGEWPTDEIDHIDLDKTNNKFANLRQATPVTNHGNLGLFKNNTSGFKGVYWEPKNKKWAARIKFDKVSRRLGLFKTKEDAAEAYNKAALFGFKEYARINEINRGKP